MGNSAGWIHFKQPPCNEIDGEPIRTDYSSNTDIDPRPWDIALDSSGVR